MDGRAEEVWRDFRSSLRALDPTIIGREGMLAPQSLRRRPLDYQGFGRVRKARKARLARSSLSLIPLVVKEASARLHGLNREIDTY